MNQLRKYQWSIIALIAFWVSFQPIFDPDFGWHLATGRHIVEKRNLITTDPFSYSLPNHPYIAHSWAFDTLIFLLYQIADLLGVSAFFALLTTATVIVLTKVISSLSKDHQASWWIIPLIPLLVEIISQRAQIISVFYLSLIWWWLHTYQPNSSQTLFNFLKWNKMWAIPILFFFWANLHAGFVWGLGLIASWIIINVSLDSWSHRQLTLNPSIKYLTIILGLSFLATLITPYGIGTYQFALDLITNPIARIYNSDWVPLLSGRLSSDTLWLRWLIVLVTAITLWLQKHRKAQSALLAIALLLTLGTIRYAVPMSILLLPLATISLYQLTAHLGRKGTHLLIIVSASLVIITGLRSKQVMMCAYTSPECYGREGNFPYSAVQILAAEPEPQNIFNFYTWGGYLSWQLPQHKIFIDGRMDNFFVNGRSFLTEFVAIEQQRPGWQTIFESYDSTAVLVPRNWPLVDSLTDTNSWDITLANDQFTLMFPQNAIDSPDNRK